MYHPVASILRAAAAGRERTGGVSRPTRSYRHPFQRERRLFRRLHRLRHRGRRRRRRPVVRRRLARPHVPVVVVRHRSHARARAHRHLVHVVARVLADRVPGQQLPVDRRDRLAVHRDHVLRHALQLVVLAPHLLRVPVWDETRTGELLCVIMARVRTTTRDARLASPRLAKTAAARPRARGKRVASGKGGAAWWVGAGRGRRFGGTLVCRCWGAERIFDRGEKKNRRKRRVIGKKKNNINNSRRFGVLKSIEPVGGVLLRRVCVSVKACFRADF